MASQPQILIAHWMGMCSNLFELYRSGVLSTMLVTTSIHSQSLPTYRFKRIEVTIHLTVNIGWSWGFLAKVAYIQFLIYKLCAFRSKGYLNSSSFTSLSLVNYHDQTKRVVFWMPHVENSGSYNKVWFLWTSCLLHDSQHAESWYLFDLYKMNVSDPAQLSEFMRSTYRRKLQILPHVHHHEFFWHLVHRSESRWRSPLPSSVAISQGPFCKPIHGSGDRHQFFQVVYTPPKFNMEPGTYFQVPC